MLKYISSFTLLIVMMLFITGCRPAKTKAEPPSEANSTQTKEPNNPPGDTKTEKAESGNSTTSKIEKSSPQVKPENTEPNSSQKSNKNTDGNTPTKTTTHSGDKFNDTFKSILKEYVTEKGFVDYATLKRKRLELIELTNEQAKLNSQEYKAWPVNDKIAFWINVYNTQLMKIIVDNYPIHAQNIWNGSVPKASGI